MELIEGAKLTTEQGHMEEFKKLQLVVRWKEKEGRLSSSLFQLIHAESNG